jgi:hypothetical protein
MIIKRTDPMGATCLSLTSKYFALLGLGSSVATFPDKKGRYLEDIRRITFLNLLKSWVPKEYRMCYICRIFRTINGGHLQGLVEEKYTPHDILLDTGSGIQLTKKVMKATEWKDEDWTFMSLGRRVTKSGLIETRTFCPACVRGVDSIGIGRRRLRLSYGKSGAAVREKLGLDEAAGSEKVDVPMTDAE